MVHAYTVYAVHAVHTVHTAHTVHAQYTHSTHTVHTEIIVIMCWHKRRPDISITNIGSYILPSSFQIIVIMLGTNDAKVNNLLTPINTYKRPIKHL